jgi:Tfp pilus assembly protein PilF
MTVLGLLHLRNAENREAFEYFGQALALDPNDTRSILGVSSIMQDRSEYDISLVRYRTMA